MEDVSVERPKETAPAKAYCEPCEWTGEVNDPSPDAICCDECPTPKMTCPVCAGSGEVSSRSDRAPAKPLNLGGGLVEIGARRP